MRRTWFWLGLLAGCGRIGFDARVTSGDAGDRNDGMIFLDDGGTPIEGMVCQAVQLAVTLGAPASNVIAAAHPSGYALAFISGTGSVLAGVALDSSLQPNASTPFRTSPLVGLDYVYSNASLTWDGTSLAGAVSVLDDGSCWIKTYPLDMMTYSSADQRVNCLTGEPSVALATATPLSMWFVGSTLMYTQLAGDGTPTGGDVILGAAAATIVDGSIASGQLAVAALGTSNGSCEFMTLPAADSFALPACQRPRIVSGETPTTYVMAYESAGDTKLSHLLYTNGSLVPSLPISLGTGTVPVLFGTAGSRVAIRAGTSLEIRATSPPVQSATILGLPSTGLGAFDAAGPYIFATFGTSVYAISCN